MNKVELEKMANDHWSYVRGGVIAHEEVLSEDTIDKIIGHHYKTAFIHGFKHGGEYISAQLTGINNENTNNNISEG